MQLPEEYAARMQRMLGTEYEAFVASYERKRRLSLRVNTLKVADPSCVCNDVDLVKTRSTVITDPDETQKIQASFAESAPWTLEQVPWASCGYYYSPEDRPGRHAFHEAGVYYIQEASAMSVAALSGARPGERILDLCAAPGGKTTQLAAMMQGQGVLVANEIGPTRARVLSQNVERMGIRNGLVTNETPEHLADRFAYYFDRVIVDAPCSGEGMFRSKDEALPLWSQEHVAQCAARQQDILDAAARMIASGGVLVYSTCTFAPEEDEESIAAFLAAHPDYEVVDLPEQLGDQMTEWGFVAGNPDWCRTTITYDAPQDLHHTDDYRSRRYGTSIEVPEDIRSQLSRTIRLFPHKMGGEGHFLALLRKAGTHIPADYTNVSRREDRVKKGNDRQTRKGGAKGGVDAAAIWNTFAAENLVCDLVSERAAESGSAFLTFGDELYLEPAGISLTGLKVIRPGLHLGSIAKGRFEPSQALAEALHPDEVMRIWNIGDDGPEDSRDAAVYLHGESIPCDPALKGWTLVTVSDRGGNRYSLGWGKAAGGMLKNHYPKGLRRPY